MDVGVAHARKRQRLHEGQKQASSSSFSRSTSEARSPKRRRQRVFPDDHKDGGDTSHLASASSGQDRDSTVSRTSLLDLPIELLYNIHLYSKNPAFVLLNRRMHTIFQGSPTGVKAQYLIARWHEAYCYGFFPTPPPEQRMQIEVPDRPPLPTSTSSDLLGNGALPELIWNSRFIPVLPVNEWPFPLHNSQHRSADHFILDYCLRYRLTTVSVLHAVEEIVLNREEFGNIVAATGLWRDDDGLLHAHEQRSRNENSVVSQTGTLTASTESFSPIVARPVHLRITELPKHLFQGLKSAPSKGETETIPAQDLDAFLQDLDPALAPHLRVFASSNEPLPPPEALRVLLSVAASHVPTTMALPAASAPFNSFDGLPLAKATFARSIFMVQLLLALGAEPSRKGSLSLYIAIRSGWLAGLKLLVERDEHKIFEWQAALDGIRQVYANRETRRPIASGAAESEDGNELGNEDTRLQSLSSGENESGTPKTSNAPAMTRSPHKLPNPVPSSLNSPSSTHLADGTNRPFRLSGSASSASPSTGPFKRRRLLDRANVDSKMLKEAVKHGNWPVANWIRSKGIIPDLRTIKLLELKQEGGNSGSDLSPQLASLPHVGGKTRE